MRTGRIMKAGTSLAAAGLIVSGLAATTLRGDEPRGIGRLFRFGNTAKSSDSATSKSSNASGSDKTAIGTPAMPAASLPPSPGSGGIPLSSPVARPPAYAGSAYSMSAYPSAAPATPPPVSSGPGNRIAPQARHSHAATEADPLVTRVSLGRADDGKQFGMFLEIFADGTVIDSEGTHKISADLLRPIAQVIQSGELMKLKGYCGGPAADFIEQHQVVVYDRYLGRLRAHAFSFSGNPQGCDASVKQLNAAVDAVQAKLTSPATGTATSTPTASAPVMNRTATPPEPIGLTPDQ